MGTTLDSGFANVDTLSAPSVSLELGFLSVLQEAAGVLQLQLRGLGVKARVVAL